MRILGGHGGSRCDRDGGLVMREVMIEGGALVTTQLAGWFARWTCVRAAPVNVAGQRQGADHWNSEDRGVPGLWN